MHLASTFAGLLVGDGTENGAAEKQDQTPRLTPGESCSSCTNRLGLCPNTGEGKGL